MDNEWKLNSGQLLRAIKVHFLITIATFPIPPKCDFRVVVKYFNLQTPVKWHLIVKVSISINEKEQWKVKLSISFKYKMPAHWNVWTKFYNCHFVFGWDSSL